MWAEEVEAFQDSGLSKQEYARNRGISVFQLKRWIRILGSKGTASKGSILPAFLPVNIVNSATPKPSAALFLVEVDLPNGRRLRAHLGADVDMKKFADVLDAIDGGDRC